MVNNVRTGAFGYLKWGLETTYGTAAVNLNKVFGFEQKITSWNYTNSRLVLPEFNRLFPKTFVYGQARGGIAVDFILSSPWFFDLLFDTRTVPASGAPNTFNYSIQSKAIQPFTVQVGFDQVDQDNIRNLQGCVLNSLTLRSSVGEAVRGAADMQYSKEVSTGLTIDPNPVSESDTKHFNFPYTFAHGTLEYPDGTVIAQLQEVEITFNQNPELLYTHSSNMAVSSYRKTFEVTGRFKASWLDMTQLNKFYAQIAANSQTLARTQPTLNLAFNNGLSGDNQNKIEIKATDIGLGEHMITGFEPNEPVFEEVTWQLTGCTVDISSDVTPPDD